MSDPEIERELFPNGLPNTDSDRDRMYDLYKLMVASSESLVSRRQGVNTFFLTLNGALISAIGLIVGKNGQQKWLAVGVFVLSLFGLVLAIAWKSLITSFGQLNKGKFKVINRIEKLLPIAIYAAEWKALGEGRSPKIYKSFTDKEVWVPKLFFVVYVIAACVSLFVSIDTWNPES